MQAIKTDIRPHPKSACDSNLIANVNVSGQAAGWISSNMA
jgi:hypothetical protein